MLSAQSGAVQQAIRAGACFPETPRQMPGAGKTPDRFFARRLYKEHAGSAQSAETHQREPRRQKNLCACLRGEQEKNMTEVVAALIWDGNKFMICQRPAHKARGLLWEFVGGKVEPGETKEQALIRECREELAVTLDVGEVFMEVTHAYPDLTVHLTLFHASIREGVPQRLEHNDIRWITASEVDQYAFCPADEEILRRIRETCPDGFLG